MKTNRSQQSGVGGVGGPERFSLRNDHEFWELTFNARRAVVPQHQALFYVAWLLANPPADPIPATTLATIVFDLFAEHPDFDLSPTWLATRRDDLRVTAILRRKQRSLEVILRRDGPIDLAKSEAQRELAVVEDFQETFHNEITHTGRQVSQTLHIGLHQLYTTLIRAVDAQGNPHTILRSFATHLQLHILVPSAIASAPGTPHFTYQPPPGITWSQFTDKNFEL